MKIEIITNDVEGGWAPEDLANFLGGNEESITLLAGALARAGQDVTVFTSLKGEARTVDKVNWKPLREFRMDDEHDVLMTVKDRAPWFRGCDARLKLHWCNDVEVPWSHGTLQWVDKIICLGSYHRERVSWMPDEKVAIIPLGMDMRPFRNNGKKRDPNLAVYISSPDRGLETLLEDWEEIKKFRPDLKLFVTYGYQNLINMGGQPGQQLAAKLQHLMSRPDIQAQLLPSSELAKLLKTATYYVHPLNRADSDLFGFSMMKARAAGCTLVVPSVANNGFREMADKFIPYREWITGRETELLNPLHATSPQSWDSIAAKHWLPLLEGKEVSHEAA